VRQRALWLASGFLGLGAWQLGRALEPARGLLACPVRHLLGIPCPGCGMTRSLLFLAHGDWRAAVAQHPLGPLLVAEGIALWVAWGLVAQGVVAAPSRRALNGWLIGHAVLLFGVWAWRYLHGSLPV